MLARFNSNIQLEILIMPLAGESRQTGEVENL